jgi:hypothetical protein
MHRTILSRDNVVVVVSDEVVVDEVVDVMDEVVDDVVEVVVDVVDEVVADVVVVAGSSGTYSACPANENTAAATNMIPTNTTMNRTKDMLNPMFGSELELPAPLLSPESLLMRTPYHYILADMRF